MSMPDSQLSREIITVRPDGEVMTRQRLPYFKQERIVPYDPASEDRETALATQERSAGQPA